MLQLYDAMYDKVFTLDENQIKAWVLSYYFPYEKAKYCISEDIDYSTYLKYAERAYNYIYHSIQDLLLYTFIEFDVLDYFDTGKQQPVYVRVVNKV